MLRNRVDWNVGVTVCLFRPYLYTNSGESRSCVYLHKETIFSSSLYFEVVSLPLSSIFFHCSYSFNRTSYYIILLEV